MLRMLIFNFSGKKYITKYLKKASKKKKKNMVCSVIPPSKRSLHTKTIQPISIANEMTAF